MALFGLIAMCGAYGEGAIADWGALHLEHDLGADAGLAAAGYAAFALAEACGRMFGSWLLARLGQTPVVVLGGLTAGVGMLAAALAPVIGVVSLTEAGCLLHDVVKAPLHHVVDKRCVTGADREHG